MDHDEQTDQAHARHGPQRGPATSLRNGRPCGGTARAGQRQRVGGGDARSFRHRWSSRRLDAEGVLAHQGMAVRRRDAVGHLVAPRRGQSQRYPQARAVRRHRAPHDLPSPGLADHHLRRRGEHALAEHQHQGVGRRGDGVPGPRGARHQVRMGVRRRRSAAEQHHEDAQQGRPPSPRSARPAHRASPLPAPPSGTPGVRVAHPAWADLGIRSSASWRAARTAARRGLLPVPHRAGRATGRP